MPFLIVEYVYDPPLTDQRLDEISAALKPCLDVRGVRRLRSWISLDRTRGLCEYVAADAEAVRQAYRSANVDFGRVWTATRYEAGESPSDG